jgi:hypothetical protein
MNVDSVLDETILYKKLSDKYDSANNYEYLQVFKK